MLDVPALVAESDHAVDGNLGRRERGGPDPVAGLGIVLVIELPSHRVRFQGPNHAHGSLHLRPGVQGRNVPPPARAGAIAAGVRRLQGEEPRDILIQSATLIFEHHQRVLVVREQQVEERRLGGPAVAQHHINGARIRGEHARQ